MKKNNDVAIAGVSAAVVGVASEIPAISGAVNTLIATASGSCIGTAVSAGAVLGGTVLSIIGAPALIIGGIGAAILFAER